MSNVLYLSNRRTPNVTHIPIRDEAERQRLSNQYCINLTTIFRKMYGSLGEERTANIIDLAHSAALADHKTDKRSG